MERDMDLIRGILLRIEDSTDSVTERNLEFEGVDRLFVAYQCELIHEEGLISDYQPFYGDDENYFFSVGQLTYKGHDLLDTIRNASNWTKIKDIFTKQGIPLMASTVLTKGIEILMNG